MPGHISVVLLAAGLSSRMGKTKQLLPLAGRPLIIHCLDAVTAAGISDIIVVLGHNGDAVAKILNGMPIRIVFNELHGSEMADSARRGLSLVSPSSTGVIMYPSDYPLVKAATIMSLMGRHDLFPDRIIIPAYNNKRGHPALFPAAVISELYEGITLRDIINRHAGKTALVPVPDPGVLADADTEEDYNRIVHAFENGGGLL